jgi:hypothetical protein
MNERTKALKRQLESLIITLPTVRLAEKFIEDLEDIKTMLYERIDELKKQTVKPSNIPDMKEHVQKKVQMMYNAEMNTLIIDASEGEIDPKFLQYFMEYQEIPKATKVVYTRD